MSEPFLPQEASGGLEQPRLAPLAPGADPLPWLKGLCGSQPEAILECIFHGDPLELRDACPEVMRRMGYMFDPTRLMESALEELAFQASRAEPGEILSAWVDSCIQAACERLCERDAEDPLESLHKEQDERYPAFIVEWFNVRDIYAKQGSVLFNLLPRATRLAFYEVYAEGLPVQEYLERTGETRAELRVHLEHALQSLGCLDPDGIPSSPMNNGTNEQDRP